MHSRTTSPLLAWLASPSSTRGVRFAGPGGSWHLWSYDRLAELAAATAAGLAAHGVERDDVVCVVERASPNFVGTLFGVLLAGATPCLLAPPAKSRDTATYAELARTVLTTGPPSLVVTDAELRDDVAALGAPASTVAVDDVIEAGAAEARPPERPAAAIALVQFTSGTSGRVRGVRVPRQSLEANVAAIRGWLRMTVDDPTASWLPVHHDMGLIGCVVTPVVNGSDLWLMRPEEFVRSPLRYVECFGRHGARLTAMPTFGLDYVARRVARDDLTAMDFGAWRAVIVGAERVDAGALERFHARLADFGFRRTALLPAYGLAEATLAVTGVSLDEEWRAETIVAPAKLGDEVRSGDEAQSVVGCGRPLAGAEVSIVDGSLAPVPEGVLGEIVVAGDSVASGYAGEPPPAATRFAGGVVYTGDAGYLRDGELFVLGRLGDSVKVRGRTLFAEDVETALAAAGIAPQRSAALLGVDRGAPTVVVLVEQADGRELALAREVVRACGEGALTRVVDTPRGAVARTTSGKPKRRQLWHAYVAGRLPAAS